MIKIDTTLTVNLLPMTLDEKSKLDNSAVGYGRFLLVIGKLDNNEILRLPLDNDTSEDTDRYNLYSIDGTLLVMTSYGEFNYKAIEELDTETNELEVGLLQIINGDEAPEIVVVPSDNNNDNIFID